MNDKPSFILDAPSGPERIAKHIARAGVEATRPVVPARPVDEVGDSGLDGSPALAWDLWRGRAD